MPQILAGRYIVTKPLARGGFGATFVARDRYTPGMRDCVIKQLLPTGLNPQQMEIAKQMFEREGVVLEDLGRHPQIPDLLAYFELEIPGLQAGTADEFFYLAQEFIDGFTLEQLVEKTGAMSEQEVSSILTSLLPVLQFVHDRGSIHRDIKPSNIMARKTDGQFYLLDFGAVKQITTTTPGQKARSTGIFTPGYGAPEQMRGDHVLPASDLYAFGVTCICLLTAKQPEELFDVSANRFDPSWQLLVPAGVSDRLVQVLAMMIKNAPNDRYQSASAVYEALAGKPMPTGMTTAFNAAPNPRFTQPPQPSQASSSTPVPNQPVQYQQQPIAPPPAAAPISPPRSAQPAQPMRPQASSQPLPAQAPQNPVPANPINPPPVKQKQRTPFVLAAPIAKQLFAAFLVGFEASLAGIVGLAFFGAIELGLLATAAIGIFLVILRATSLLDNKDMLVIALLMVGGFWAAVFFGLLNITGLVILISITSPVIALLIAAMAGLGAMAFMTLFRLIFGILYALLWLLAGDKKIKI